jgi:hypothetical protein
MMTEVKEMHDIARLQTQCRARVTCAGRARLVIHRMLGTIETRGRVTELCDERWQTAVRAVQEDAGITAKALVSLGCEVEKTQLSKQQLIEAMTTRRKNRATFARKYGRAQRRALKARWWDRRGK